MKTQEEMFHWEITLADGSVKREGTVKFNESWQYPGKVKYAVFKNNETNEYYGVDLEKGQFDFNGRKYTPKKFKGGKLGDYSLKIFKRNTVEIDAFGNPISKAVTYYLGYEKNGEEKLLKVHPAIMNTKKKVGFAKGE